MFVDSIDAVNGNLSDDYKCLLASSGLEVNILPISLQETTSVVRFEV